MPDNRGRFLGCVLAPIIALTEDHCQADDQGKHHHRTADLDHDDDRIASEFEDFEDLEPETGAADEDFEKDLAQFASAFD